MRCKTTEPTTSEKVKGAAVTVAAIAAAKAGEAKVKTETDILPALAERADAVREAAAPHLETAAEKAADLRDAAAEKTADLRDAAADKTADHREAASDKLGAAKAVAAAKLADVAASAADARDNAVAAASDKADEVNKKTTKAADSFEKNAKKSGKKAQKKATKTFGPSTTQKAAFGLAALRGKAKADDKLNADAVRDYYNDELLPHLKEVLAAAAASGTAASADLVSRLPQDAQKQVVRYAPALAPAKKKGGALIVLGGAALAGAGYLFYAERSKKATGSVQVSQTAAPQAPVAVTTTHSSDALEGGNSMAEIFTHETVAEPANGPGTAAAWTEAEQTGHMSNVELEGNNVVEQERQGRHAARDDS